MKKLVTTIISSLLVFMMTLTPIFGDTVVTFDGESDNFTIQEGSATDFEGMQPGESRWVAITLTNDDSDTMNFFMSAEILDNIAEKGNQDAVYDFTIERNGEVFFSTVIGSEGNTIGEEYLTENNQIMLAELARGESCNVRVTLHLDGDSTENPYMRQSGQIKLAFSVGTPDGGTTTQTVIERIVQYVRTGDNAPILLMVALLVGSVAGIAVYLVKRKKEGHDGK